MSDSKRIRAMVEEFWRQNPIGQSAADAFPAWWISTTFETSGQDAAKRCAVGPGDQGLDGYYLERNADRGWILHLVQAKFSNSRTLVRKAIEEFKHAIPEIRRAVDRQEPERGNPHLVYSKLRAELDRNEVRADGVRLHFHVIHLCDEPEDVVQLSSMAAGDRFKDLARTTFPEMFFALFIEGPDQFKPTIVESPSEQTRLRFEGIELKSVSQTRYFTGLTYLSDLVGLYNEFGEQLFSKNVRYYLFKERGQAPARFMRDTLRAICVGPHEKAEIPEHFAMFHNGVTLAVHSFQCADGTAVVRNPSILNGCQTIRNASRFVAEVKDVDPERWRQVPIPIRILVSADEEFIRRVTVNNNRQIPVRPSAFFANDRIQLDLARRFELRHIYYERQQGGFQSLRVKESRKLVEQYGNSVAAALTMEDLAQAIATTSNKPSLSVAARVSSLFEESLYPQVFAESKLRHLELLVFLRNLLRTMKVALKDVRDRVGKLHGLSVERFRYPCTRILARYIVKYQPQLVAKHGVEVYGHVGPAHPFRKEIVRLTSHQNSGLQQLLSEFWYDGEQWKKADDADAVRRALARLNLDAFDVFREYEPVEND